MPRWGRQWTRCGSDVGQNPSKHFSPCWPWVPVGLWCWGAHCAWVGALLWPWAGVEIYSCGFGLGLRSVIAFTLGLGFDVRCRLGLRFRFGSAYFSLLVSGLVWVSGAALLSASPSRCGWHSSCPGKKVCENRELNSNRHLQVISQASTSGTHREQPGEQAPQARSSCMHPKSTVPTNTSARHHSQTTRTSILNNPHLHGFMTAPLHSTKHA